MLDSARVTNPGELDESQCLASAISGVSKSCGGGWGRGTLGVFTAAVDNTSVRDVTQSSSIGLM